MAKFCFVFVISIMTSIGFADSPDQGPIKKVMNLATTATTNLTNANTDLNKLTEELCKTQDVTYTTVNSEICNAAVDWYTNFRIPNTDDKDLKIYKLGLIQTVCGAGYADSKGDFKFKNGQKGVVEPDYNSASKCWQMGVGFMNNHRTDCGADVICNKNTIDDNKALLQTQLEVDKIIRRRKDQIAAYEKAKGPGFESQVSAFYQNLENANKVLNLAIEALCNAQSVSEDTANSTRCRAAALEYLKFPIPVADEKELFDYKLGLAQWVCSPSRSFYMWKGQPDPGRDQKSPSANCLAAAVDHFELNRDKRVPVDCKSVSDPVNCYKNLIYDKRLDIRGQVKVDRQIISQKNETIEWQNKQISTIKAQTTP